MGDPELYQQFRGHRDDITGLHFCPTKKRIVSSSKDQTIMLWNFTTDSKAHRYTGHTDAVFDVQFSRTSGLMASASRDKTIRVWDTNMKGESSEVRGHMGAVRSVQFSPDNQQLVSSSDDKTVKLWSVQRTKFLSSFTEHTNWVRCSRWSPDGRLLVSCADDKTVKIWDSANPGQALHTFNVSKGFGQYVEFHPSGACVGVATSGNTVEIYDIRARKLQQLYNAHEGAVNSLSFHPSGNYCVSASNDQKIKVYDLLQARPIYTLSGHQKEVNAVAFSPKGDYCASGGNDNHIFVWKLNLDVEGEVVKEKVVQEVTNLRSGLDDIAAIRSSSKLPMRQLNDEFKKLETENKENNGADVNTETLKQLKTINKNLDTLTQTVLLMEKRLCLVEDQIKILSQK